MMDVIAFLRKFTIVRLSLESICLIIFMMFLTAHAAFYDAYVGPTSEHSGITPHYALHAPEVAIGWLFFYFLIPRTVAGWTGILSKSNTTAMTAHVILTGILIIMYSVTGLVCVFTESFIELILNFIVVGIEISSLIISYKLLQDVKSRASGGSFDWKRLFMDQQASSLEQNAV